MFFSCDLFRTSMVICPSFSSLSPPGLTGREERSNRREKQDRWPFRAGSQRPVEPGEFQKWLDFCRACRSSFCLPLLILLFSLPSHRVCVVKEGGWQGWLREIGQCLQGLKQLSLVLSASDVPNGLLFLHQ